MARIVLIHGIGQQSSNPAAQVAVWLPSLVKGVLLGGAANAGRVAAGLASAAHDEESVAMAFYGDLFLADGVQGEEPAVDAETLAVADSLAVALLRRAAAQEEARLRDDAAVILAQLDETRDGVQGAGGVARTAMARLDANSWLAQRIFGLAQRAKPDLLQVARYLTNHDIRAQIQARVQGLIADDTRLVIAHSLGSIVGWESCQRNANKLPMLITIGSPLGLDTVVYPRLRPSPPTFPLLTHRWVNVAHLDDIVAVEPHLAPLFPSQDSRSVEDHTPRSRNDHHNAATYLEQPVVGRTVSEILNTD